MFNSSSRSSNSSEVTARLLFQPLREGHEILSVAPKVTVINIFPWMGQNGESEKLPFPSDDSSRRRFGF